MKNVWQSKTGEIERNHGTSKNICILLDSDRFYYPFIGGIEKHCYELTRKLTSKGINIFLISRKNEALNESAFIPHLSKSVHFHIKRIPPTGTFKGQGWKALFPMIEYVTRIILLLLIYHRSYDIIMISGFKILSLPAILVAKLSNKKCILKIESPDELTTEVSEESLDTMSVSKSSILLRLVNAARNAILKNMDQVIAISQEIEGLLTARGVQEQRISVIPSGIDIDRLCPIRKEDRAALRIQLGLPEERMIFVYTGRLTYNKGALLLVHAWKQIREKHDGIHLLLIGPGTGSHRSCEEELRTYLREHRLEDSVSITGEVPDVTKYLQASDIFVFPSEYEGFSLSLLEALACSLPTIVTRVGSAPEVVINKFNGILIQPRNRKELEEAFHWFLGNRDQWEIMGNHARRSVFEQFSMDTVTNKYVSLFEILLGNTA